MSETRAVRNLVKQYCQQPFVLDIGFGGDAVVPHAITFDMERPYTNVGEDRQIIKGNCRDLSMFCDGAMDVLYSSHLLEDFAYNDLINIVSEWRRVLRQNGLLITNCPDQQRFLAHCARTGQSLNMAHYEQDFSLLNFKDRVIRFTGEWETVFEQDNVGAYSWVQVLKKR